MQGQIWKQIHHQQRAQRHRYRRACELYHQVPNHERSISQILKNSQLPKNKYLRHQKSTRTIFRKTHHSRRRKRTDIRTVRSWYRWDGGPQHQSISIRKVWYHTLLLPEENCSELETPRATKPFSRERLISGMACSKLKAAAQNAPRSLF